MRGARSRICPSSRRCARKRRAALHRDPRAHAGCDASAEQAWPDEARGKNLRQIEQAVAGRKRGDRPGDPAGSRARRADDPVRGPGPRRWRRCGRQTALELERGERLDDDALISALCNAVLEAHRERRGSRQASDPDHAMRGLRRRLARRRRREEPLDAADLACAECDAQRIGSAREPARATQDVPPKSCASCVAATLAGAAYRAVARRATSSSIT